jgi:spore germination cell wall hydrolase CwlJ-like protein
MKVLVIALVVLLLMPVKIQIGQSQTNASAYDQKLVAFEESIFVARQQSIECMALNIYHEARSLSTAGRLAVAQVTLNRVN